MIFTRSTLLALVTASLVSAHMKMTQPLPLTFESNPDLNAPMKDSTFPCNVIDFGGLINGPGGSPVETWAAGSQQTFAIGGGASHGGGSCQAVLSEDKGQTWKVIQEFIGSCPLASTYSFNVPKDAKSGNALFGWTWFNRVGNREMYMNCASVTITGGGSGLGDYKNMFIANLPSQSTCITKEMEDIDFTEASCGGGGAPVPGSVSGTDNSAPPNAGTEPSTPISSPVPVPDDENTGSKPLPPVASPIPVPDNDYTDPCNSSISAPLADPTSKPAPISEPTSTGRAIPVVTDAPASPSTGPTYDDGMWHPDKYPSWKPNGQKIKRAPFKLRGFRRGIFGGPA
ncbi:hypothetical protein EX30DRAFT_343902 [Ascodesmis nigricans]|uniref:Lytic polysaccharide monooxygenase n=1 Tax=Ascodesmis nigricans TaxID=341454 RepID=A0A4S2MRM2_9PEZI|nr:hypothetical protein EX30DRAFT_343902 [Ascodesmis nigricans]